MIENIPGSVWVEVAGTGYLNEDHPMNDDQPRAEKTDIPGTEWYAQKNYIGDSSNDTNWNNHRGLKAHAFQGRRSSRSNTR